MTSVLRHRSEAHFIKRLSNAEAELQKTLLLNNCIEKIVCVQFCLIRLLYFKMTKYFVLHCGSLMVLSAYFG